MEPLAGDPPAGSAAGHSPASPGLTLEAGPAAHGPFVLMVTGMASWRELPGYRQRDGPREGSADPLLRGD